MPPYSNPYQPVVPSYPAPATPMAAPMVPQQPQAPQFDPESYKKEILEGVQEIVGANQEAQQQPQQPQAPQENRYLKDTYNNFGDLENDTKQMVQDLITGQVQATSQQQTQAQTDAQKKQEQYDTFINQEMGNLRQAGYLPAIANQYDPNDPGKQSENELIGYALSLGTAKLDRAAQELKVHHEKGERWDYRTNQWVNANQEQQTNEPNLFGNFDDSAQQPQQAPYVAPQQPVYQAQPQAAYPYPTGPQNPYMPGVVPPQYPAGFNAPVSTGGGYMGTQGQGPDIRTIRNNNYDGLLELFNRTQ